MQISVYLVIYYVEYEATECNMCDSVRYFDKDMQFKYHE